jgi:hypothetical protein
MNVGVMKDYKLRDLPVLTHWVGRGNGTPKDKDEVNREVSECESRSFRV